MHSGVTETLRKVSACDRVYGAERRAGWVVAVREEGVGGWRATGGNEACLSRGCCCRRYVPGLSLRAASQYSSSEAVHHLVALTMVSYVCRMCVETSVGKVESRQRFISRAVD